MNPGLNNRQVLEIYNASNHPLALFPGTKMCQFIFLKVCLWGVSFIGSVVTVCVSLCLMNVFADEWRGYVQGEV